MTVSSQETICITAEVVSDNLQYYNRMEIPTEVYAHGYL